MAATGEESDLGQVGNDGDGVRALHEPVRNELVARVAQLLEHLAGHQELAFLTRLRVHRGGRDGEDEACEYGEDVCALGHA